MPPLPWRGGQRGDRCAWGVRRQGGGSGYEYAAYFLPRRTIACERVLAEEGRRRGRGGRGVPARLHPLRQRPALARDALRVQGARVHAPPQCEAADASDAGRQVLANWYRRACEEGGAQGQRWCHEVKPGHCRVLSRYSRRQPHHRPSCCVHAAQGTAVVAVTAVCCVCQWTVADQDWRPRLRGGAGAEVLGPKANPGTPWPHPLHA